MIGTSNLDLYIIRIAIFFIYYFAPLCILFCLVNVALYGLKAAFSPVPLVIECIAVAEIFFYLFVYRPYRAFLQREAVHPPLPPRSERMRLFLQCNNNVPDPEAYLRRWFLGAPMAEIKRDNMKEFFLWAFFNRSGPPGDDDEELEEYIALTEQLLGKRIEPGRGNAESLRLTLDKVDMMHRGLVWYLIVGLVDLFTYVSLLFHGFHFHRLTVAKSVALFPLRPQTLLTSKRSPVDHLPYWHRKHTSTTKLPILFLHGIGIGLLPYVDFLAELNSATGVEGEGVDEQVGIIAIEILPISFRITHPAMAKDDMCDEIGKILAYHGWDEVVVVAHSFGSVIATHLLKSASTASSIGPVVLIDPVTILLHMPDVAYNFMRRKPQRANEHQLQYFASMDMGVSHSLARHFFWSENILWKEDLKGRKATVCLASEDLIVNTYLVGKYLTSVDEHWLSSTASSAVLVNLDEEDNVEEGEEEAAKGGHKELALDSKDIIVQQRSAKSTSRTEADIQTDAWKRQPWKGDGIDVIWFENLDHAQVFDRRATRRPVIQAIKAYCAGRAE